MPTLSGTALCCLLSSPTPSTAGSLYSETSAEHVSFYSHSTITLLSLYSHPSLTLLSPFSHSTLTLLSLYSRRLLFVLGVLCIVLITQNSSIYEKDGKHHPRKCVDPLVVLSLAAISDHEGGIFEGNVHICFLPFLVSHSLTSSPVLCPLYLSCPLSRPRRLASVKLWDSASVFFSLSLSLCLRV